MRFYDLTKQKENDSIVFNILEIVSLLFLCEFRSCVLAKIGSIMGYGSKEDSRMSGTRFSSLLGKITVVVICFFCLPAKAKYGGGTGEPNDPYLI